MENQYNLICYFPFIQYHFSTREKRGEKWEEAYDFLKYDRLLKCTWPIYVIHVVHINTSWTNEQNDLIHKFLHIGLDLKSKSEGTTRPLVLFWLSYCALRRKAMAGCCVMEQFVAINERVFFSTMFREYTY